MTNSKVAVVTGAGSGIGLATAARMAGSGYTVFGTSRSRQGDDWVKQADARPVRCDVTDERDCVRLAETVGECDVLVCAAGGNRVMGIQSVTVDDWAFVFDLNARAVFFLNQLFGTRLRHGGAIVNVASTAAKTAVPSVAVYAAAKAAVLSITRSFAIEYASRGIRVNAVLPKIIDTSMQRSYLEGLAETTGEDVGEIEARRLAEVPLKRAGTPDECASVIAFLAGDGASYVTGQSIHVCGGWLMS